MSPRRPSPIDIRRIQQRAQVFGTSALELMLVITFLILLMLLAYFSLIAPEQSSGAEGEAPSEPSIETPPGGDAPGGGGEPTPGGEEDPGEEEDDKDVDELRDEIERLEAENEQLTEEKEDWKYEKEWLVKRNNELNEELGGGHQWPPIIRLEEADGYSFRTNSSEIADQFEQLLIDRVVPRIVEIGRNYDANTIEIVGHTDERPVATHSNLDEELLPFLRGRPSERLSAADNAGLGFARAAAVARLLVQVPELSEYRLTPLSGAQVILRGGTISTGYDSGDRPERRRIEIRMRRADE